MNFVTATDRLRDGPTLTDVANELRVRPQTLRQARMDPGASGYRHPPTGWQTAVAKLARKRATELVRLAEQLERGG